MSDRREPAAEPEIIAAPRPLQIRQYPAARENYGQVDRTPKLIVLHCTQGCEGGGSTDTNVAAQFADPHLGDNGGKRRSAHYVIDSDSITQCVQDLDVAWHCGHHGNALGIGIELCGRAEQTRAQWLDAPSKKMLGLCASLCIELCARHRIPLVMIDAHDLARGLGGITTHAFVASAWHESTHTDPGQGFPLDALAVAIVYAMQRPPPLPGTPPTLTSQR